jgi:hypothetical protein
MLAEPRGSGSSAAGRRRAGRGTKLHSFPRPGNVSTRTRARADAGRRRCRRRCRRRRPLVRRCRRETRPKPCCTGQYEPEQATWGTDRGACGHVERRSSGRWRGISMHAAARRSVLLVDQIRPQIRSDQTYSETLALQECSKVPGPQGLDFGIPVGLRFCGWVCVPPMGGI